MTWQVGIKNQDTRDFLRSLDSDVSSSIGVYFSTLTSNYSKSDSNSSITCENTIYVVTAYTKARLEIHYHVNTVDKQISITKHILIPNN